jgi:hypothetical protein
LTEGSVVLCMAGDITFAVTFELRRFLPQPKIILGVRRQHGLELAAKAVLKDCGIETEVRSCAIDADALSLSPIQTASRTLKAIPIEDDSRYYAFGQDRYSRQRRERSQCMTNVYSEELSHSATS